MTPAQQARVLRRLELKYGPEIRKALSRTLRQLPQNVDFEGLVRAIASGRRDDVIEAIGLSGPLLRDYEREISRTFEEAGSAFTKGFPTDLKNAQGLRVLFRFDMHHPLAERALSDYAARSIEGLLESTRKAIGDHLSNSLALGLPPEKAALELAGRIDPISKRRKGGLLGLDRARAGYVRSARSELLSGDPGAMRAYLRRKLRDKSFDGHVRKAIAAGRPVSQARTDKIIGRYSDRQLMARAKAVARDETLHALSAGQHEAFRQGAETVGGSDADITRVWDSSGDGDVRETHVAADGQRVVGMDTPFVVGGQLLRHPRDPSLGASQKELRGCRCHTYYLVDFLSIAKREAA